MTFATIAPELFAKGYPVLPAKGKAVLELNWQNLDITEAQVTHWATNGQANSNIGVRTGDDSVGGVALTLADIDIKDKLVSRAVGNSLENTFGVTVERRGQAPKRGLIYAMDAVFKKIQTVFVSPDGVEHKMEWLASGQQFIAHGIHPDTNKPYTYRDRAIESVELWEYPRVTEAAVMAWQNDVLPTLLPAEWVIKGAGYRGGSGDTDDILESFSPTLDITKEEVLRYLSVIKPDDGYDRWNSVGMALHHQFCSDDVGKQLWTDWSRSSKTFSEREINQKWQSFSEGGDGRRPLTFATVIKWARESDEWAAVEKAGKVEKVTEWLEKIDACEDEHDLQSLIEDEVAFDRTLGPVDIARLEQAAKTKLSEQGAALPIATIRKMFKKKGRRPMPDQSSEGKPLETLDNLQAICDNLGVVIRYNVVKKDDEILIPDVGWSIDNRKSASLTWVRGMCHKNEMSSKYLKNFVTLMADHNQYNPVAEWIASKPWDGVSRLPEFFATVTENKNECSTEMKETLLRRWMLGAVAATMNPNGTMVRGVLVFQGEQYSGKTRWIDSLAPKDLELIKTGKSLNVHDKDSVKQILSCWIAELGELDATFKKSDIAALKAFITNDMDELRRPYAEAESQFARRTVFAASVNEKQFLQDDTGNSRFWVLPVSKVNFDHGLDMQQVWAEVHQLWAGGEVHYLSHDEMKALNSHNEGFEAPNPIAEMISSHLDWDGFSLSDCKWMTASDVLRWIGHKNPTKWDATAAGKAILKLNKGHCRKSNGQRLSAVPTKRRVIGWDVSGEFDESSDLGVTNRVIVEKFTDPLDCPF